MAQSKAQQARMEKHERREVLYIDGVLTSLPANLDPEERASAIETLREYLNNDADVAAQRARVAAGDAFLEKRRAARAEMMEAFRERNALYQKELVEKRRAARKG